MNTSKELCTPGEMAASLTLVYTNSPKGKLIRLDREAVDQIVSLLWGYSNLLAQQRPDETACCKSCGASPWNGIVLHKPSCATYVIETATVGAVERSYE